jgi:hypothetical protein
LQIDGRTYGVEGCGQRATYVESCQPRSWGLDCTWVLNGETRTATEAGSAVASSASSAPTAAAPTAAAPSPVDPKACESATEYRQRAENADGLAKIQLTKLAERKEAACKQQKGQ